VHVAFESDDHDEEENDTDSSFSDHDI
jgi:hypothetical protein